MLRARAAGASGTDRLILAALWTYADRHGGCWPSQRTLAGLAGRCERTVRSAVKRMEAAGVIVRAVPPTSARRWGWTDPATGGRRYSRRSTVYTLAVDASREPRRVETIGAPAEPSPELVAAVARVEAAVARAAAPAEHPPECEVDLVAAAPVAAAPVAAVVSDPIDRQSVPPKSPNQIQTQSARATPQPAPPTRTWQVIGASLIARAARPPAAPPRPGPVAVSDITRSMLPALQDRLRALRRR